MKKTFTFLIIMLLFATVSAQMVNVTFTGRDAQNHYLPMNRVVVSNLTKGWQETLYWPDTVLTLTDGTGIEELETQNFASLRLSQNTPNPFDGTTFANLQVAESGDVKLVVTDIVGRIVGENNYSILQPGIHEIRITLSTPGLYFLTARQNGRTTSVKMVNRGNGGGNAVAFVGVVETLRATSLPQSKNAHRGETDNPFSLGDQMEYVGFAMQNDTEVESGHVIQMQEASQTIVLAFGDGAPCSGTPTVTDHEGNVYATVQIGSQCWTRDNLRTTTSPSTGTYLIPVVGTGFTCTGKQARWYNNDSVTFAPMNYGLLYNWNAAMDTFNTAYGETSVNMMSSNDVSVVFTGNRRGICPAGWHLPSHAEWTQLTNYVSGQSEYTCGDSSSNIAKALASTEGWNTSPYSCDVGNGQDSNNATGFSAVPAGEYWSNGFNAAGSVAYFWSSTEQESSWTFASHRAMDYIHPYVYWHYDLKSNSFSVRCLRD